MAPTRKYTLLNMQQRLNVLKDLQETKLTTVQLAEKYGVVPKTIHRIKKNSVKINAFSDKSRRQKRRQKIFQPVYIELDQQLHAWYTERKSLGHLITDALMLEKAMELKENLPSTSACKVSRGWLAKFKARHGIRLVNMYRESESADEDGANLFEVNLEQKIREENISFENIYNMDGSGLVWKALPTKTLAEEEERNVSGQKAKKDRVTVALCANASGSHKMTPLLIYKYKNPRALRYQTILPVIFKSQRNSLMTREIFQDWFDNHFKPSARQHQERTQIYGKIILLVENCEAHKISVQEDEEFEIVFLPPNTTSVLQPMDQGVIAKVKAVFRHRVLQRALAYNGGLPEFYADYTLKDCIYFLAESWATVTQENIKNAWDKFLNPASLSIEPAKIQPATIDPATIDPYWQQMMSNLTGERCTLEHVAEFLSQCDEEDRRIEPEEEEAGTEEEIEEPTKDEISMAFDILCSATTSPHIQQILGGLKTFYFHEKK